MGAVTYPASRSTMTLQKHAQRTHSVPVSPQISTVPKLVLWDFS